MRNYAYISDHYNTSDYNLVSTLLTLCVLNLYMSGGGTYSLKSTPNDKFFNKKLGMAILFTKIFYTFIFLFRIRKIVSASSYVLEN